MALQLTDENTLIEHPHTIIGQHYKLAFILFCKICEKDALLVNQVTFQALQWSNFRRNKYFTDIIS